MQLSGSTIFDLCVFTTLQDPRQRDRLKHPEQGHPLPMIHPFVAEKHTLHGVSYGLSVASYDLRIAHDLTLGPSAGSVAAGVLRMMMGEVTDTATLLGAMADAWALSRPSFAIAHTLEDFALPLDVSGQVCDKSTYARLGVSCFNTFFDPGFIGNGTLELVNLSPNTVVIRKGDPICQMIFNRLDRPVPKGYDGKYQFQPKKAVPAIFEGTGKDPEN